MSGSNGPDGPEQEHDDVRPEGPESTSTSEKRPAPDETVDSAARTERFAAVTPPERDARGDVEPGEPQTPVEQGRTAESGESSRPEKPPVAEPPVAEPPVAESPVAEPPVAELPGAESTEAERAETDETARTEVTPPISATEVPLSDAPTAVIPVIRPGNDAGAPDAAVTDRIHRSQEQGQGAGPHDDARTTAMSSAGRPPQGSPVSTPLGATTAMPPASPPPATPPPPGSSGPAGGPGKPWSNLPNRTIALVVGGVVALLAVLYVADLAMSSGKVPRGVTVAGVEIGGTDLDAVESTLSAELTPRLDAPVTVTAGDTQGEIVPSEAGIGIDWPATVDRVGSQPLNPFARLASFFGTDEVGVVSTRDDAAVTAAIDTATAAAAHEPREGNIVFEDGTPVPLTPQPGQRVDTAAAVDVFTERWPFGDVSLPVESVDVTVTREGLDRALAEIAVPAVAADLTVRGVDGVVGVLSRDEVGAVLSFVPDRSGGLEPRYDNDAAIAILAPQLAESETEPKNAQIVLDGGRPSVVPGEIGELVDWARTLETLPDLLKNEGDRAIDAVYERTEPELTTEAAEKLGIREVVSEYTTGGFEYASGVNIRLAASAINGALVKPGDTFSFNGHTGPRGAAQGYVESGIIEAGRPGKAVGGGISQLATTLYNATYFAGMEDVEHTEHSYYISRYPAAREATIYDGAIDLKFRNPFDTGVLIQAFGTSSDVTVRIWGTKTVDVQSITGNRTNYTSPNTITLPAGDGCIAAGGAQGFTVTDTRIVTDSQTGSQISNKTRTVRYDPVPIVKCVSPERDTRDEPSGDGAPAPGGNDAPAEPGTAEPETAEPEAATPAVSMPPASVPVDFPDLPSRFE